MILDDAMKMQDWSDAKSDLSSSTITSHLHHSKPYIIHIITDGW